MPRPEKRSPETAYLFRRLTAHVPMASLIHMLAVAEYLSFRHAAHALGTSQSSVSSSIRKLEDELRLTIFERTTRGVRLTEAGRQLVSLVSKAIDQIEQGIQIAGKTAAGEHGRLRVGTFGLLRDSFLDELLVIYRTRYPGIDIEITEGSANETIALLRSQQLDIAFVVGRPEPPDCHSRKIWSEPLLVALPERHRLVKQSSVTWRDLAGEIFIVRRHGLGMYMRAHVTYRLDGFWPPPNIQCFDVGRDTLLTMVAQGHGITLVGGAIALLRAPGLTLLPISDEPTPLSFSAVWSPHNRSFILRKLLSLAAEMERLYSNKRSVPTDRDGPSVS